MSATGGWRLAVGLLLLTATACKFAAFTNALSFSFDDSWKVGAGAATGLLQALLWWVAARGLGVPGVLGAWLLQSLYLAVSWSYFAYFGLHLTFATVISVGGEGLTAVAHGSLPVTAGMLWLLLDLPFVLAWCALDRARWRLRWTLPALLLQAVALAWLVQRAEGALQWAAAERDDRYTAPTVFIPEFGLLPIQIAQARRPGNPAEGFVYGPEVVLSGGDRRRDILVVQVESLDVGGIATAMPYLAARAAQGVWYERCLAYHGPGGSADADVAVIEGIEPLWDAVSFDQVGHPWPNSWVRRLREAGWSGALAHGLPGAYFNFSQVMPRLGFELWDLSYLGLRQHPGEFGARDNELVDAVLARLPSLPAPYVLHVVTMTSHKPFTQHRAWWPGPVSGDDYRDCLRAVDAQLERLLAGFHARSPDGLVVLFGDHASGRPGSASERRDGEQREYVPLLLLGFATPPRCDRRLASFLDIGRTVLPAAGWSGAIRSWGADLVPPGADLPPTRFRGASVSRSALGLVPETHARTGESRGGRSPNAVK